MKEGILKRMARAVLDIPVVKQALHYGTGSYRTLFAFNGEKNLGELGPVREYMLDYDTLRARSWQALLENDMAKTIIDRTIIWMIGTGLKAKAKPAKVVLASEGIVINSEAFNEVVEARWEVWSESRMCSYDGMMNLPALEMEAFKNRKVGGDVLVILRYIKKCIKVQLIDGCHLQSPGYGSESYAQITKAGNKIMHGVEMDKTGRHIAYHIRKENFEYERVPAVNSLGITTAFLVYGTRYRLDNVRGIPNIAISLETIKKLERYKEAAVGSAEERQKIAYAVQHQNYSTGTAPWSGQFMKAFNADSPDAIPTDALGQQVADKFTATTNKMAFNLPRGAELKALDSKNEMFFKEFYGTNADVVCAAQGIPPNVAFMMYTNSFSSSRMATKDWEHSMRVDRKAFADQFHQNIYNFWLYTEILNNKIQAPGYLIAVNQDNQMVVESYRRAHFTGPGVPHIDPLKEANALRVLLGSNADHLPLITLERATENMNTGDSDDNMAQFAEELKEAYNLGIEPVEKTPPTTPPAEEPEEDKKPEEDNKDK